MIRLTNHPVRLQGGVPLLSRDVSARHLTMAQRILSSHHRDSGDGQLHIRFDAMLSHDITYVGIIQTARACGMARFPMPYALTNCHNSLCAVGGTINEDDHAFGLSAAVKYGGIYVPANQAVIHQYAREALAGAGKMLLGSDSHTRYGALGCMGIGEGGPELVKQLLGSSYDIPQPGIVLVWLTGALQKGVGPHDVALSLCKAVYENSFVKNKVLEFTGPGVAALGIDTRLGIDVMTTETACLSSIWHTDEAVQRYYIAHGRPGDYQEIAPQDGATYDAMIEIDLSQVEPMIALPYHPSNAMPIREYVQQQGGEVWVEQGVIAGCAGGMFENIREAAAILRGHDVGDGAFSLSVYPSSVPQQLALMKDGCLSGLLESGALLKPCFCGPCFGAGDVPANGTLSIRHTTRNFKNREGSRPQDGQSAYVVLMDARSIAATARNHGRLTAATDVDYELPGQTEYAFDPKPYRARVYNGFGRPKPEHELRMAPSIADWPAIEPLKDDLLVELCAVIRDPVTTTDELIPSGETSSYRSNPMKLAEFTLSRRDPGYVSRAKAAQARLYPGYNPATTSFGSAIFCNKPGDGSAREQAASCQRVLGGAANLCYEYATKRYRSNVINWGMLPFTVDAPFPGEPGDLMYVPGIRAAVEGGTEEVTGQWIRGGEPQPIRLYLKDLSPEDREILLNGCLINTYKARARQ